MRGNVSKQWKGDRQWHARNMLAKAVKYLLIPLEEIFIECAAKTEPTKDVFQALRGWLSENL